MNIKSIIKRVFPIIWLKQSFLLYNKIKINTIDRILYRTYRVKKEEAILSECKNPFIESKIDLSRFPENIRRGFSRWTDLTWTQDQYLVRIDTPFSIDPETGWAVANGNELIYPSLGFSQAPYVKKPSLFKEKARRKVIKLTKVISLRDTGEENYFHFFNDVIAKLWFLKDVGLLDPEAHVIISYKLWVKEYFKYYLVMPELSGIKWCIQNDEWIEAKEGIFCKPYTHTKQYWLRAANWATRRLQVQKPQRIFLTRPKSSLRFIENEGELTPFLIKNGFLIINPSDFSFSDQAQMFSCAEIVIAIHGAGISNVIFRNGQPLHVLEIFHPNEYLPFHYIMLCKIFGYGYSALEGVKSGKNNGGFLLDRIIFETAVNELLQPR